MRNKPLLIAMSILLTLLPVIVFSANGISDSPNQVLQFFKGDGAIEDWFINAFKNFEINSKDHYGVIMLGKAIGQIGAIFYMGHLGWEMQDGQRPWAVTPMIKPVIIALILSNWNVFTNMIKSPLNLLAKPSIMMFNEIEQSANVLRIKRYELQRRAIDKAMEIQAENEKKKAEAIAQETAKKDFVDKIIDGVGDAMAEKWDSLTTEIEKWTLQTQASLQTLVAEVIEAIALIILRVCVYGIFGFQKAWSAILVTLGPIAVGMSLIPGFDGAIQSWVAKFININLWTFISFQSMSIGSVLISAGYKMEINRYESILKGSEEQIIAAVGAFTEGSGFINILSFTVVGYLITGLLVLMTPTIADSILSAGGSQIANAARGAASSMAAGGKKAGQGISIIGSRIGSGMGRVGKDIKQQWGRSGITPSLKK